jgi:hypothetical protein
VRVRVLLGVEPVRREERNLLMACRFWS